MTEIENLIYQFEGQQREIMLRLHDLLTNEYNLTSKITFGCPSYYGKSWICYLKPTKQNTIELTFFRGNELSKDQSLAEDNGNKQLLSVDIGKVEDIPETTLKEVFHEALLLDKTTLYESIQKAKNKKSED